jgi:hypothetical protein
VKDAFGVSRETLSKAHHHHYTLKRVVKELTSQSVSTGYSQSKKKRKR